MTIGVILHYKSLPFIWHIFLSLMSGGNYKDVAGIESTSRKNGRNTKIKHQESMS